MTPALPRRLPRRLPDGLRVRGPSEGAVLAVFLVVTVLGVWFAAADRRVFELAYVAEDGPTEWLGVLALALCAALCLGRALALRPFRERRFTASLAFMGLVFLFGVGEELSWGQRLIGFESPEPFLRHNAQRELNVHNLVVGGVKINKLVFGASFTVATVLYLLAFPPLRSRSRLVRRTADAHAVPVPRPLHVLAYAALGIAATALIDSPKRGEILECGGCWLFLAMFLEPANKGLFARAPLTR